MSNLYWYSHSLKSYLTFSNQKVISKGFILVEEICSTPLFKQFLFQKDYQQIRVYLYVSEIQEEMYLFVQECDVKEVFIQNLKSKAFQGFHSDIFITEKEPLKIIAEIEKAMKYSEEDEYLHIYGQPSWHGDAFIVGNRAALQRLRDTINQALQFGEKKEVFFPEDEEGYSLYISCTDDSFDLSQLDLPYHDPDIFENRKPPVQAFKQYKFHD
ncbi:hypothetical protein SporoP8_00610 [Sporosarcina ureae]|uniref:hypothetical protein n=1 Tax=Sporosarcina ureae TaxID=1571 RepID=UPI000A166C16|nr:hypothetical protein [Sporosarcina ureae]ARJ37509.1 hypothetical protein SporoP8_00610 [Sporosarcina ureae]